MNSKKIFFNDPGRLRSGWRFAIFLFSFLFFLILFSLAAIVVLSRLPAGFNETSLFGLTVFNFISFLCALVVGSLCGKFLEDLPYRALGARFSDNWLKNLIYGSLFGAAAILLASLIAFAFGGLRFQFNQTADASQILTTLGASCVLFTVGAASEETLFRGYILQTFARANLAWFAVFLTAVFFGTAHLQNPNVSWISTLNTMLAGILFGVAYLKTRTLWFPFGLHLMWNWVQGAFLGIPVSGLGKLAPAPLFQAIDAGPIWLTGGRYGIEGGFSGTIALIITILAVWLAPFLKATGEMSAPTNGENPKILKSSES